jgi:predicted nucleic acid-binding protein
VKAISNTSPLIFLHSVAGLAWLDELFEEVWVPTAVIDELVAGQTCRMASRVA